MNRPQTANRIRVFLSIAIVVGAAIPLFAVPGKRTTSTSTKRPTMAAKRVAAGKKPAANGNSSAGRTTTVKKKKVVRGMTGRSSLVAGGPWKEPTFADSALGDVLDGEDLIVRQAAVSALGPYNGSVVVVDPTTGRILSIVNQKLALHSGFQPCSTIKVVCALAGLHEGLIERSTMMRLSRRVTIDMTDALATSNNYFFAKLGEKLGFEKVSEYAKMFGLGEKAGYGIEGEFAGKLPAEPPKFGGVGMMTSFGEGIQLTTLQLASMFSAIANGGTLYHLQYPRTPEEIKAFTPMVKRQLNIASELPDIKPGMMGAVEYGTARKAFYDPSEPILGKTGTCTDRSTPTHLGWFGSYNEVGSRKLAVVVLLTGGKAANGSVAAQVAGAVYRGLSSQNYYNQDQSSITASTTNSGGNLGDTTTN